MQKKNFEFAAKARNNYVIMSLKWIFNENLFLRHNFGLYYNIWRGFLFLKDHPTGCKISCYPQKGQLFKSRKLLFLIAYQVPSKTHALIYHKACCSYIVTTNIPKHFFKKLSFTVYKV